MGVVKSVYKILFGISERKRPFGRSRRRWEYNIKMDIKECRELYVAYMKEEIKSNHFSTVTQ
jgi:hypothetical protein